MSSIDLRPLVKGQPPIPNFVLGITGQKHAGKDTIADLLVEENGFVKVRFADAVREHLEILDPYVFVGMKFAGEPDGFLRLSEVIDRIGWDQAKTEFQEVRRLMQVYATEVVRTHVGGNYWVNQGFKKVKAAWAEGKPVVISDVRFPNEHAAITAHNGYIWRVDRPGLPEDQHISEQHWKELPHHYLLNNDTTEYGLKAHVRALMDFSLKKEAVQDS